MKNSFEELNELAKKLIVVIIESEEEKKKKMEQKWADRKGPMNHQLIDQDMHCGNPRRRGEREWGRENIWKMFENFRSQIYWKTWI